MKMKTPYRCQVVGPGWSDDLSDDVTWVRGEPRPEEWKEIHGMIAHPGYPLGRTRLEQMTQLLVIATYGTGYDYVDVKAASDLGILVTHTPDAVVGATAELGLTLTLALLRHVVQHDTRIRVANRSGAANPVFSDSQPAHDIQSQVVGLVGYGRVGQRLGSLLRAVGFAVRYTRPHGPLDGHLGYLPLAELLASVDIVIMATPLNAKTFHLIGASALSKMKPGGLLVNIGRGATVDQEALEEALVSGQLGGAALDVFEGEPLISDQLMALPQVILSPHVGSNTVETRAQMTHDAKSNIMSAFLGKAQNAINAEHWRRRPTSSAR